jgi:hypothetical protein
MKTFIKSARSAIALVAALLATPAFAAVTFDPSTGTGFVGKGEVQRAFTWNNKQLQDFARGVSFSYDTTDSYSAVCTWTTGEGTRGERTHNVSHKFSSVALSAVDADPRQTKGQKQQFTGFILSGFGPTSETGSAPVVGGPCMGNQGRHGVWSSVTPTGSTGGLWVRHDGLDLRAPR